MEFVGRMMLCGVRAYHAILDFVEMFMPVETVYSSSWKICNPDTSEYVIGDTREEFSITDDFSFIIHYVRKSKGLHEDFRAAVHWPELCRDGYVMKDLFDSPPPPWLFIGYRDEKDTYDCTEMLRQFVCYGNMIHVDLLNFLVPEGRGKTWVYINPKTFEEVEFPSDGMVIEEEDEPDQEAGDKKNN